MALPAGYAKLLEDLKARIHSAQVRASLSVNRELIALYWDIGRAIVQSQQQKGYGERVVEQLAADLFREFPDMKGLSQRNVWFMRSLYLAYSEEGKILKQLVSQSSTLKLPQAIRAMPPITLKQLVSELDGKSLPQAVAGIPWGHNIVLIQKLKHPVLRLWYAHKAMEHGWSRAVLIHQIDTSLHKREGKAVTNFKRTLPPPQSELAEQTLKDPYNFDFLTLAADAREHDLEKGLLDHIQKFLLELGVGFAFVGRQYHMEVEGEDYYFDLLFYHLRLRCYVVIDLKMEPFKPEFAGKMNFYLSAADDKLRQAEDRPSIGLLLCKGRKRLTAEYALRDMRKPIGVAEWQAKLVESLPKDLRNKLPTVKEIEAELAGKDASKTLMLRERESRT